VKRSLVTEEAILFRKKENKEDKLRMVSSGLLRRVDLVRTDVSEEPGACN
jgi:hypothetical protein